MKGLTKGLSLPYKWKWTSFLDSFGTTTHFTMYILLLLTSYFCTLVMSYPPPTLSHAHYIASVHFAFVRTHSFPINLNSFFSSQLKHFFFKVFLDPLSSVTPCLKQVTLSQIFVDLCFLYLDYISISNYTLVTAWLLFLALIPTQ